jgi:hypothetical protein
MQMFGCLWFVTILGLGIGLSNEDLVFANLYGLSTWIICEFIYGWIKTCRFFHGKTTQ